MAISLNNHESRIKMLENSNHNGKKVMLFQSDSFTSTINLSETIHNFDFLIIGAIENSYDKSYCLTSSAVEVSWLSKYKKYCANNTVNGSVFTGYVLSVINDKQFKITFDAYIDRIAYVLGLTIYYIVRYNIYKLVQFLSHLNTKFGGERRWVLV